MSRREYTYNPENDYKMWKVRMAQESAMTDKELVQHCLGELKKDSLLCYEHLMFEALAEFDEEFPLIAALVKHDYAALK